MLGKAFCPSVMPAWLIRREVAIAAAALILAGISNYSYLLECFDAFATSWVNDHPSADVRGLSRVRGLAHLTHGSNVKRTR